MKTIMVATLLLSAYNFNLLAQDKIIGAREVYISSPILNVFLDKTTCYFQAGKYTQEELRNTEMLVDGVISFNYPFDALFSNYKVSQAELEQKVKNYISICKLVKGSYWEQLRKNYLAKYEYDKELERVKKEALTNPAVLANSRFATYCTDYIDVLNGSDIDLRNTWSKLVERQASRSSISARVKNQFLVDAVSTEWKAIAREYVVNYGWGNCFNDAMHKKNPFYTIDKDAEQQFRALFLEIDEPEVY